jgi:dye decolorizing peroxidase
MAAVSKKLTRRQILGGGGAAIVGAAVGGGVAASIGVAGAAEERLNGADTLPFYGEHQSGITTPAQSRIAFIGLNLKDGVDKARLAGILRVWTSDAERLTSGRAAMADSEPELAVHPARLTITVGLGAGALDKTGLAERKPEWLKPLPPFSIDKLEERWGQTDALLQIGADDAVTVAHVARELVKNVRTLVEVKWVQNGFRRARGTEAADITMRNLMGQVDGTENPRTEPDFDNIVWDDGSQQPWLAGGTGMVLRRIYMELDSWDELDRLARELTVGRNLANGAPLGGENEFDELDLTKVDQYGLPVIPPSSHVARAHYTHQGERMLRRGYNYDEPPAPGEVSNSGLIFVSYQRDITSQFVPVQQRLADFDALNEWTIPIGSAVYAILPGVREGGWLGEQLLG